MFLRDYKILYTSCKLPHTLETQQDAPKLLSRKNCLHLEDWVLCFGSCMEPSPLRPVSLGEVNSRDVCQVRGWLGFNQCPPEEDRQAGRQVDRKAL